MTALLPVSATTSNFWTGVPTLISTVEKVPLFSSGVQVEETPVGFLFRNLGLSTERPVCVRACSIFRVKCPDV